MRQIHAEDELARDAHAVPHAGAHDTLESAPRYNGAPTQDFAVLRLDSAERAIAKLRWGLIPAWAKDVKIGARLINARAETVHQKPAFRAAFKRRRCLVPADG